MNIFSLAASRAAAKAVDEQLHKPRKGDGSTVHLPRLMLIIGIICTTVFLIPAVVTFIYKEIFGGIAFLVISLFCSSLIIAYINQRIYYDSEGFTAKSFFGIKRRYSYSDIEYSIGKIPHDLDLVIDDEDFDDIDYVLDLMTEDIRLMAKGKKILIDQIAVGGIEFLAFAQKQYKLRNGGRPIPEKKKTTKCDAIFNGNVKNATATIVIDIVVAAFFMAGLIFIPFTNVPTEMDELTLKTVTVQSYTAGKDLLEMKIDGFETEPYFNSYKETFDDVDELFALLDSKEPFEIGYTTFVDDGVPSYTVEYVRDQNGKVLTTPQDYYEAYQDTFVIIMLAVTGLNVAWIAYVILSIYVGRNPEKFSAKFVHKFFKEGTIRI